MTHLSEYTAPRSGRNVRTICGCWVDRTECGPADRIDCPDCKALWDAEQVDTRTADDVFGTVEEIRAIGPTVTTLAGYRPKE